MSTHCADNKHLSAIAAVLIALALVVGCEGATPVPTPVSEATHPSATPVPPTATPVSKTAPTVTVTPLPPLTGSGGGVIAFVSERRGKAQIYVMNADGSDQQQLTSDRSEHWYPDWSPDGKQLAFHVHHGSAAWSIHAINADGTDPRRLTSGKTRDAAPVWSPAPLGGGTSGTQIVFSREGDVWVMDADGVEQGSRNQRQLTTNPANDGFADWSPDGTQIVFCSNRDGNWEIYVMNTDGSDQRRLTNNSAEDSWPDWSPDGKQIAFKSKRDGNYEIYVMAVPDGTDTDGANMRRLTDNQAEDGEPDWSPDGTRIAFESNRDRNFEIYVMNVEDALQGIDGSNVQRLTNDWARDIMPAWRP